MNSKVRTMHYPNAISGNAALALYNHLKDTIVWDDGIPSKHGFTRKAKALNIIQDDFIAPIIQSAINICDITHLQLVGCYLNYYRNGNDYTPNHSHKDTVQVIISLGETRTLMVGKKAYTVNNGDVTIFGSSVHGVPKDVACVNGRISIALFLNR